MMEDLYFQEIFLDEYQLKETLLDQSRISENNRARLFSWLSDECSKQRISRYTYTLTCAYVDLYFMRKKDLKLKDYQLLALGALILATKQIQTAGKVPSIDRRLFRINELLDMQMNIAFTLNFYLNPPIYIELLNNIAKMWDIKCETGQINSNLRLLEENKSSYLRMKTLYEKMDCLILFKKILDFDISEVVVTLFYFQTRKADKQVNHQVNHQVNPQVNPQVNHQVNPQVNHQVNPQVNPQEKMTELNAKESEEDNFQQKFQRFLIRCLIITRPSSNICKILQRLTTKSFPISDVSPQTSQGQTFAQLLSVHTHNRSGIQFHRDNHGQVNQL